MPQARGCVASEFRRGWKKTNVFSYRMHIDRDVA
jgi:hypothetical protein